MDDHAQFRDKNLLLLTPDGDPDFLVRFNPFDQYFRSTTTLDFAAYCVAHGQHALERHIVAIVKEQKIDMIVALPFATNYEISVEFYAYLSSITTLVFWFSDDENYLHSHSKYFAQAAHAVVTTDYFGLAEYERLGIPAVLYWTSYSSRVVHPLSIKRDIDVSFYGDCTKSDRQLYFRSCKENGLDLRLFGRGSDAGFVPRSSFSEIISRSKINLNFTKLDRLGWVNGHDPMLNRVRQNKGRPIEVALAGGFCLSEYAPSLKYLFNIGTEIDVFADAKDMVEKARYYLSHNDVREEMARASHERAMREYEESVYFERTLDGLCRALAAARPPLPEYSTLYLSDRFKAHAVNGLFFTAVVMLKKARLRNAVQMIAGLGRFGMRNLIAGLYAGCVRVVKTLLR